ncbi:MAG: glycosyltransferase family 4 protein [Actinobacteria bacterium]|nr:glycosyltransferase family 4 protein [Actinomycetota bacterium]
MIKENVGIITFPIGKAGFVATSNLVEILSTIFNETYLITGNVKPDSFKRKKNIYIYNIEHKKGSNFFLRSIQYITTQLKISYRLIKINRNTKILVFFIGGNTLIIPMIFAKLLRKKVILMLAGSSLESFRSSHSDLSKPIEIFENINRLLTNRIIVYSPNLIKEWNLNKYNKKILISNEHFLDYDLFKIIKKIDERKNIIGYIGRFSEEKGILTFIEVISILIKKFENAEFLIGGNGELRGKINNYIESNNLTNKVTLTGWIPHDTLPEYLNKLKLLILPSYTEGLPNILLEAMACGTPVLATSVGTIPDIITDGETGFIITKNTPEDITKKIISILKNPNLNKIVDNARNFVEKKYNFNTCLKNYEKIMMEVLK